MDDCNFVLKNGVVRLVGQPGDVLVLFESPECQYSKSFQQKFDLICNVKCFSVNIRRFASADYDDSKSIVDLFKNSTTPIVVIPTVIHYRDGIPIKQLSAAELENILSYATDIFNENTKFEFLIEDKIMKLAHQPGDTFVFFTAKGCHGSAQFGEEFERVRRKHTNFRYIKLSVNGGYRHVAMMSRDSTTPIHAVPAFIHYKDGIPIKFIKANTILKDFEEYIRSLTESETSVVIGFEPQHQVDIGSDRCSGQIDLKPQPEVDNINAKDKDDFVSKAINLEIMMARRSEINNEILKLIEEKDRLYGKISLLKDSLITEINTKMDELVVHLERPQTSIKSNDEYITPQ